MPVWGTSSRGRNRINPDGSYNVYCWSCGSYIARVFERATRAKCALCDLAERGIPITEDALRAYKLSKAEREDVTALTLPDDSALVAMGIKKNFSLTDIAGDIFKAVGKFAASEKSGPPPSELQSVKLAKSKRRPRLFSGVSLADQSAPGQTHIGEMGEVLRKMSEEEKIL